MTTQMGYSDEQLTAAIQNETEKFRESYHWLKNNMPAAFFEEMDQESLMLVVHNLMDFHLQGGYSQIHLDKAAIAICFDSPDADLEILKNYSMYGIKTYQAYVSKEIFPFPGKNEKLRIASIIYTEAVETGKRDFPSDREAELKKLVMGHNPEITDEEFSELMEGMNTRFLVSLPMDKLALAIDMYFRAKTRDHCQYEVTYNEDWQKTKVPSMQIVMAWKNTPKHNFMYRLAKVIHRHKLVMSRINGTYINPYSSENIVVMALSLHGQDGRAAWENANVADFLKEMVTLKFFGGLDSIDDTFVDTGLIRGNLGNLLRTMNNFIHQALVHVDAHRYTMESIEEALCRHPELTVKMLEAFEHKFHPEKHDMKKFEEARTELLSQIDRLDTGHEVHDTRRKNVLRQGMNMIDHTLKTNFYRNNKLAFSFRLDPKYLDNIPFDRKEKFPDLPYGIFFIKGMHFFGFQIRFKDLSRGGLRTVYMEREEQVIAERNNVFTECYNLAHTQQKKNKDIPEGGSKGVIFLKPYVRLDSEAAILSEELTKSGVSEEEVEKKIKQFRDEQKLQYLYHTQRSFISSLLTIINCEPDGKLRSKDIVDHWNRPEYIYLGPDENMHNNMIEWISEISKKYDYKPGSSFISSKPDVGINHKEFGVTSMGVNVYMHEMVKYLGLNPEKDKFTVKITGGPSGDVAGNQIANLYKYYRNTAQLLALTDGSGTIYDPNGLDLSHLYGMFVDEKSINEYPAEKLSDGGFLLDRYKKRDQTAFTQQTLCYRKKDGKVVEDWLSGSEMNSLFRTNVHQVKTDIFIPAGGRPRTLSESTFEEFLDEEGVPTSRAVVEGANLYLTPGARRELEDRGCLVIKDSSANKGGVICSSFEVLMGLVLSDEEIMEQKESVVEEILEILRTFALKEAQMMLRMHKETGGYLTDISDKTSAKINRFTYTLLDYLDPLELNDDPENPMNRCLLHYAPPSFQSRYRDRVLNQIPDHHKKAIVACHIGADLVYKRGLNWNPNVVDILPLIWGDPEIGGQCE